MLASGVRRSCDSELRSEVRSCSASYFEVDDPLLLGERRALEGDRGLAEQRLQELSLRRVAETVHRLGAEPHDAEHPLRRRQGQVHRIRRRQGLRAEACGFAVLEDPLRHAEVAPGALPRGHLRHQVEPPVHVGQDEHHRPAEQVVQVAERHAAEFGTGARRREVATHGVEGGAPVARAAAPRWPARAPGS